MTIDIISYVKNMPLAVLWRHVKSISVALALSWSGIYMLAGPYIEARADETLVTMLKKYGMSPNDISIIQSRLNAVGKDVDGLVIGQDYIKTQQDEMRGFEQIMKQQLAGIEATGKQTNDLLRILLPLLKAEISP